MAASTNASTKTTVRFTINFFEKTITGTKASFTKAGKGHGPEYEELAAKMAAHPDFTLEVKEQKTKSTKAKKTYDGLDFKFMEDFISTLDAAKEMMAKYNAVKKMAKDCGTKVYPLTKKWFLDTFSTVNHPFDMDEAREAINAYRIQQAEKNAATALSLVSSGAPAQQDEEDAA